MSLCETSTPTEQPIDHRIAGIDRDERSPSTLVASYLVVGPSGQIPPGERRADDLDWHDDRCELSLLFGRHGLALISRVYVGSLPRVATRWI